MTPKEKAIELYEAFFRFTPVEFEHEYAKQCAIICVGEKIETAKGFTDWSPTIDYLKQVKTEINNL